MNSFQITMEVLKEGVLLHSQPKVKFREYFVYFLMGQKSLKNQPFGFCILIILKSYKQFSEKQLFNKKTGKVTFF